MMHREQLDAVVKALLERETLSREEFLAVMAGDVLPAQVMAEATMADYRSGEKTSEKQSKTSIAPPRLEPGPA
jgi:cell division protease FtsH